MTIYNTLSRKKEVFQPLTSDKVTIYTCGLTVNDYMHVGHARTYIIWDTIVRYLKYLGYEVFHVSNVTDVSIDERFMNRTKELGISYQQLVEKFTWAYFKDREALGIARADVHPLVTQHIQEIIEFVEALIRKGYAYKTQDGVYFDISKFNGYGKLSGVNISSLKTGAGGRVGVDEYDKSEAGDFVLWKKTRPGEPYWHSPWGKGRPGWHIECSTMAIKYLGETIDIHAGGEEHIFPHHENEIAQSEALTGKPFANYWVHARHVFLSDKRMSKSLKNYILIEDAVNRYGAALLRLYLLTTHYRKTMNFKEENVLRLQANHDNLKAAVAIIRSSLSEEDLTTNEDEKGLLEMISKEKRGFKKSMNNDFNTGPAINSVLSAASRVNQHFLKYGYFSKKTANALNEFLTSTGTVLFGELFEREIVAEIDERLQKTIELLLSSRERFREKGDYSLSDEIRKELEELGIQVEDTSTGPKYTFKSER